MSMKGRETGRETDHQTEHCARQEKSGSRGARGAESDQPEAVQSAEAWSAAKGIDWKKMLSAWWSCLWHRCHRAAGAPARGALSPLLWRILLVNMVPLALLAGLLLSINQFQTGLLEVDVTALREQGHIYAGALGETAVRRGAGGKPALDVNLARPLLAELVASSENAHARLFGPDGRLLVDSSQCSACLLGRGANVGRDAPPEPVPSERATSGDSGRPLLERTQQPWGRGADVVDAFYGWILSWLPLNSQTGPVPFEADLAPGKEELIQDEVEKASGAPAAAENGQRQRVEMPPYIRRTPNHKLVITVVEPVMHGGRTVGEIQLTRRDPEIDRSLFMVRSSILTLMFGALLVTVLLSWYLFYTIAGPLARLVRTSREMREPGHGRTDCVPVSLLNRRDEIGVLARALRVSTLALWARLDDTERFAAEVSHELKNPLSSIRSALETLPRLPPGAPRQRLLAILTDDVQRLERLITDISDASRIEGDLSRERREAVAIVPLLAVLVEMHETTRKPEAPHLVLDASGVHEDLCVMVVGDRLVQAIRNLVSNALSFSPPQGRVTIGVRMVAPESSQYKDGQQEGQRGEEWPGAEWAEHTGREMGGREMVEIVVADEGPGIPPAKLENIFDRFYSERPGTEDFGQHSGLGLAISRQIVQALDGVLWAENIHAPDGLTPGREIRGARFVVRLPRCACQASPEE